jgi:Glycine-rich domain-containing protein-like
MDVHSSPEVKQWETARPQLPEFSLGVVIARVLKDHSDWLPDRVAAAEHGYRQYIAMCKIFPKAGLTPPNSDIDEIWHAHILHTKLYAADCQNYLGYFLHHAPFNDESPAPEKDVSAEFFQLIFGYVPPNFWSKPEFMSRDRCGAQPKAHNSNPPLSPPCSGKCKHPECAGPI